MFKAKLSQWIKIALFITFIEQIINQYGKYKV